MTLITTSDEVLNIVEHASPVKSFFNLVYCLVSVKMSAAATLVTLSIICKNIFRNEQAGVRFNSAAGLIGQRRKI